MSESIDDGLGAVLRETLRNRREQNVAADLVAIESIAWATTFPDDARAMEAARQAIERDPSWAEALIALGQQPPIERRRSPAAWWITVGIAASLLIGSLVLVDRETQSVLIPKGLEDRLSVVVDRGGAQFRATDPIRVENGDHLGFFNSSDHDGFLAIVHYSIAERAQPLVPSTSAAAIAVAAGDRVLLEEGGVVDAPGAKEWLVAVWADSPFEVSKAVEAIAGSAVTDAAGSLKVVVPMARSVKIIRLEGTTE